jgi:hypothetical protein
MADVETLDEWLDKVKAEACFMHSFEVVFPRSGKECGNCNEWLEKISSKMSEIGVFGGTTEWDAHGCWFSKDDNRKICEPVRIITSGHNCSDKASLKGLIDLIKKAGEETHQSTIAMKGTNKFVIAKPEHINFIKETSLKRFLE